MQSCGVATTTTFSTHRQHIDTPSHYRNRNQGYAPTRVGTRPNVFQLVAQPPASSRDFYLDTLFSPVWMSGPHVFSFAKDGTVVCPKTYHTEPYPGCRASAGAASSSGRRIYDGALYSPSHSHSSSSSSSSSWSFPSTPNSKISGRANKEWKNIAISEQDDAEFVAREAEAEVRARAEAKGKLVGLVYTWPPKLLPGPCAGCEVLAVPRRRAEVEGGEGARLSVDTGIQETSVPASSYGTSRQSASESKVFLVPKRRAVAHREEVLLEKSVEFGCASPLVAMPKAVPWIEDKLTAKLKAMLRMHEI